MPPYSPQQPQDNNPQPAAPRPEQSYSAPPQHDYSFIMNPERQHRQSPLSGLSGGAGLAVRVGIFVGGLVVLLIIATVIRGLLSGGSNEPLYVTILQDQQELIHLTTNAATQKDLPESTSNFVATTQLSLTTAQADLITYMSKNDLKKVKPKELNLKVSSKIDGELKTAAAADAYTRIFQGLMKTRLTQYQQDLSLAYDKTDGPNGRKLLESQYKQALLLQAQLTAAAAN